MNLQQFINSLRKELDKIVNNIILSSTCIDCLDTIISQTIDDPTKYQNYLKQLKQDVISVITPFTLTYCKERVGKLLRHYFKNFANKPSTFPEAINFFSNFDFTTSIKSLEFNSIKAFLFYFAYQSHRYNSEAVKELLSQHLISAQINDTGSFLDFSMYCFYRGMYYLENKNYTFAAYFFCSPVSLGLNLKDNTLIFNIFIFQMIRILFFLRFLVNDFSIPDALFKKSNSRNRMEEMEINSFAIGNAEIDLYIKYLQEPRLGLEEFKKITKHLEKGKLIKNAKLEALKNLAEEEIKYNKIRQDLSFYKRTKLSSLVSRIQLEYNDVIKIIKKKVLEGKLNVKYDEVEDILEVFDVDPGLKQNVEETQKLYKELLECNKNLFIQLEENKKEKLDYKKLSVDDKKERKNQEEALEEEGGMDYLDEGEDN